MRNEPLTVSRGELDQATFGEADDLIAGDDEVVEEFDVEPAKNLF